MGSSVAGLDIWGKGLGLRGWVYCLLFRVFFIVQGLRRWFKVPTVRCRVFGVGVWV